VQVGTRRTGPPFEEVARPVFRNSLRGLALVLQRPFMLCGLTPHPPDDC